jgi:hypothetical protein
VPYCDESESEAKGCATRQLRGKSEATARTLRKPRKECGTLKIEGLRLANQAGGTTWRELEFSY